MEKYPGLGHPLGGNYHAACVDESDKAKFQGQYELIPFHIDNENILGLQTLDFSSAPQLVKRIARLSVMSTCVHASWKSHGYKWLRTFATKLDDKFIGLVESPDFQQSLSKKRIDTIAKLVYRDTAWFGSDEHRIRASFTLAVQLYVLCHSHSEEELISRVLGYTLCHTLSDLSS